MTRHKHIATRQISRETGLTQSSVVWIIYRVVGLKCSFVYQNACLLLLLVFSDIGISQGSVRTHLRQQTDLLIAKEHMTSWFVLKRSKNTKKDSSFVFPVLKNVTLGLQSRVTFPNFGKQFSLMTSAPVNICTLFMLVFLLPHQTVYSRQQYADYCRALSVQRSNDPAKR